MIWSLNQYGYHYACRQNVGQETTSHTFVLCPPANISPLLFLCIEAYGYGRRDTSYASSSILLTRVAGPRSVIGRAPDSEVRGPRFDTQSSNILSFLLPLFQEGQLSVTGESMCTKYRLTS